MVRNFQTEDRGLTFRIRDGQAAVFAEDTEILEAQQENILRRPDRELLNFKDRCRRRVCAPNHRAGTGAASYEVGFTRMLYFSGLAFSPFPLAFAAAAFASLMLWFARKIT